MSHAILSPSSAARWLACTPSARLEMEFPDNSGVAAAEGTLAHSLGELIIRKRMSWITATVYKKALQIIQDDKLYSPEMLTYADDYATYVLEQYSVAQAHTKDAVLFIEEKIDLSDYVPEGFGTGDVGIVADNVLTFIDLKYGKGVPVSAVENKQMMLYGLGMLKKFDFLYNIQTVRMVIYQPRLDSISEFEMSAVDLKKWAVEELQPKAQLAFAGEGDFLPGDHCRFCKVRATCRAKAEQELEITRYEFKVSALLTDEEVSDILNRAKSLITWVNDVQENALKEAITNGKKWPGYKLVEGRANRIISDESKVVEVLTALGKTDGEFYKKKLIGIGDMEKLITKPVFNDKIGPYVIKPVGAPTLVSVDDKRPELNSLENAVAEFADLMIDN